MRGRREPKGVQNFSDVCSGMKDSDFNSILGDLFKGPASAI